MSSQRLGTAYGIAAYALWGLLPLYWMLLKPAGPIEILAHRIVWSLVFVIGLIAIRRRFTALRSLSRRALGLLGIAALTITINWGTYIWGVLSNNVVETALGYFINPIVTVLLGVLALRERLRPGQWAAIAIAAIAVAILTIDYGRPPWIALILAFSFGTYGLVKKKAAVGAFEGIAVETAILVLPSLAFLGWLESTGAANFGHGHFRLDALLVGSGLATAIPLLLFGAAATRVPLTVLGLLQYLAPSLQFLIGVTLLGEPLPATRLLGFVVVWIALVLFTAESYRHRRARIRSMAAAGMT